MTTCNLATYFLLEEHFDAVWTIFTAVFPAKYGEEFFDAWTGRNPNLSYGVFDTSNTLRGFIITKQKDTRTQHIEFLGVDPTCQKGGIGTILLTRVLDICLRRHQRITLIPIDDLRVINWYKKQGFIAVGHHVLSPYTGDLEQLMEYKSTHTPQSGQTLQNEIAGFPTLAQPFARPLDIQQVANCQEAQESLKLLMA
jgi:ribosomal protein S18 acetylase RimI-like enzyme